jgi:hypothetical protein
MLPQFWQFVDEQLNAGRVCMPRVAFKEIVEGGYEDQLSVWCKARKNRGLCQIETQEVQEQYRVIAAYVETEYAKKMQKVREFLIGADGWVIAAALATGGIIVTSENEKANKAKIKIPTLAKHFDVRCLNTPGMLQELGADFSAK